MNIVILDGYSLNPGDMSWDEINALGNVTVYDRTAPEDVLTRAAGADAVLTNKVVITAEMMDRLPTLRYIGVLATGYNVVDVREAGRRGIVVTNIPAYSTASVAQMVFAHLLSLVNRVEHYTAEVRGGRWASNPDFCFWDSPVTELYGKTFGIVGLGNIGMAVARIALAMGMKVAAVTSKREDELPEGIVAVDIDELFARADVVSLHCPLTDATRHMVDRRRLGLMKSSAILINTGRGPLVDECALAEALNAGHIAGAGIDVLSIEPPAADNPLLSARNCHVTPHIAWASTEARARLMTTAAANLRAFAAGRTINNVAEAPADK